MINNTEQLVVFTLNEQRYALHLRAVKRIVRAVEITSLPQAPDIVHGIINVSGQILPVVNIRRRFGWSEREIDLSDQLIIALTSKRTVALLVDEVSGVVERPGQEVVRAEKILPDLEYVEGVVKFEDGLVLIHDLEKFLSLAEEQALADAIGN